MFHDILFLVVLKFFNDFSKVIKSHFQRFLFTSIHNNNNNNKSEHFLTDALLQILYLETFKGINKKKIVFLFIMGFNIIFYLNN